MAAADVSPLPTPPRLSVKNSFSKKAKPTSGDSASATTHVKVNHSRTKKKAIENIIPNFPRTYFLEAKRKIAVVYLKDTEKKTIRYGAAIARDKEPFKKSDFALTAFRRLMKKGVLLDGNLPISPRKGETGDSLVFQQRQQARQGEYLKQFASFFEPIKTKEAGKARHEAFRSYLRTAIHRLGVSA